MAGKRQHSDIESSLDSTSSQVSDRNTRPRLEDHLEPGQSSATTNVIISTGPAPPQPSSNAVRHAYMNTHRAQGRIVNPTELPPIAGRWSFLEQTDENHARALKLDDPVEATRARRDGRLASDNDIPVVIFTPNPRLFNPDEQPTRQGRWEFFDSNGDDSSRALAWIQIGGQEEYGFGNVPHPTAQQVWELRERLIDEGEDTAFIDDVDFAWVPYEGNEPATQELPPPSDDVTTDTVATTTDPTAPQPGEGVDKDLFDEDPPHYSHDLTNGGENDQTGADDLHWYRTVYVKGNKFTIDVSTARLNRPQPHKLWGPSKTGKWSEYPHSAKMDWSKKKHLDDLNGWRDQRFKRADFPGKRKEKRTDWEDDEKRWLFKFVAENQGKTPGSKAIKKIVEDFNLRFEIKRTQQAITAQCDRLSKMHAKNDGKFVVGKKRGQAMHEAAEERRRQEGQQSSTAGSLKPEDDEEEDGEKDATEDVTAVESGEDSNAEEGTEE